ncbi:hypothetical protein FSPOR_11796 [Fusarium sporotrichioides]|uniref:Heterokaryon incompatibility domain-containing protein n=1 Tax=Fusarium sporotrichioides TaxID=5514 RepID=A0A395RF88_FUSSP|nr:hypothetical protein FSPOR_11796 [Fusarium sporotrichioides]
MTSDSPPSQSNNLLVYSTKPPEEALRFGLRGSDIVDIRPEPHRVGAASPEDWGFTSPTSDGICKYCQLLLHPDAPSLIQHQPNVIKLITSGETCVSCKWLEVSITKGSPSLVARFEENDPALVDENSTACPVTVELTKREKFTRAICWVGNRELYMNAGAPVVISTPSRLGDLASRRFWANHDGEVDPHKRQNIIKTWMSECDDHEICKTSLPATRNTPLPTRVLDLTGSLDIPNSREDIVVKLRETKKYELGIYTALSYCWGRDTSLHFKTTHETLESHKEGIDFFSLPLVHREAILTTLYLGIRYIWIDSLCIIQDSHQDWQAESAMMGSVYSNAHLTIAATSSSSPDEGLHWPFQGAQTVDIHGEIMSIRFETHLSIDRSSEPLNTRGWTLQEAVLPSRLVCFGKEQWLWKCPGRYATEDGLIDGPRVIDNGLPQWPALVHEGPGEDGKNFLSNWYQLIINYSRRDLTYQTDKWNAIAGLVNMFKKQTGYTYLAGLWQEDLAVGLMWEATTKGVIRESQDAPSWSWLSVKGPIKGLEYGSSVTSMIELIKVNSNLSLKDMSLTIKGRVLRAAIGKRSVTQNSRHYIVAEPNSVDILGEAFLDTRLPDGVEMVEITCLFVLGVAGDKEYFVLILVGKEKKFQRLGMGVLWQNSKSYDDPEIGSGILERGVEETITLV